MIIDCKIIAKNKKELIKNALAKEIESATNAGKTLRLPSLAVIQIGDDAASNSYIKGKRKDCEEIGFEFRHYKFENVTPENEEEKFLKVKKLIEELNASSKISGIILQLPTSFSKEREDYLTNLISPKKDVDGFTANSEYIPCTPLGIMNIIKEQNIDIKGKHAVVVGRSNIVGKPVAKLLLDADATVTICHSKTKNLKSFMKNADILICAVGKQNLCSLSTFEDHDEVKYRLPEIIIDVGINRDEKGKLCGDCNSDLYSENLKNLLITPVPGGVGLMTRVSLVENTFDAWKKQNNI